MYWHAKIVQLKLIGHLTKRLKTIFSLGLLKSIHFRWFVTLLQTTDITTATNVNIINVKLKYER